MSGRRTIPSEIEGEIVRRYAAGERAGSLAKEYGINRKTVTTLVRRSGAEVRKQGAASGAPRFPDAEYTDRVTALRDEGLSQVDIGKRLGMSQSVVGRILRRAGYPTALHLTGERHGSWKGGRSVTGSGYVQVLIPRDDPFAEMRASNGYVLEHRLVMARALGRPLKPSETVHHINGDSADNRIGNLQLRQGRHGKGAAFQCLDCGSHNVVSVAIQDAHLYSCAKCGKPAATDGAIVTRSCNCDAPIIANASAVARSRKEA
jgi:predicted RNA-binding Zn-ribbon protein involved in translation (DUF1610 family)